LEKNIVLVDARFDRRNDLVGNKKTKNQN